MKSKYLLLCGVISLVSACGSSGSNLVQLSEVQSRSLAIEALSDVDIEPTASANLPTSNTARYSGVAVVATGDLQQNDLDQTAIGSATFIADFDEQTISGSADSFYQADDPNIDNSADLTGEPIEGSLTFDLAQIVEGSNAYEGQVTGSVTFEGQAPTAISLDAQGTLLGERGDALGVGARSVNEDLGIEVRALED